MSNCLQFVILFLDVDRKTTFLGGLDAEVDGDFAYMWEDDLMQVIFHGKYCCIGSCLFTCFSFEMKKLHIASKNNNFFHIFVVATLMPTDLSTDPKCNKKKRHIGNDFVAIVYNNAGGNQGYTFGTVKGT